MQTREEQALSRCLVVATDDHLRGEAQSFLQRHGESVAAAADGAALCDEISAGSFDVVVLDIAVPDVDGIGVSRWVSCRWGIPVILLVPQVSTISRAACLEMGADDCVADPFEPCELLACIREAMQRARLRQVDRWPCGS